MSLSRAVIRAWMACDCATCPKPVMEAAGLHLLDAVGVGLAAASLPQGAPYLRFAPDGAGPITALSGARLSDAADAALVNGGLIHSLEFDDTHTGSIVHGSAVLAATALAMGQATGASTTATIHAYLLGYEVMIRMGLAAPGAFQQKGFQITSVAGPLVAALIACDLTGSDEDTRVHAVGIALSQASGVFEFLTNGSSVKSLHPGWAAHGGILAARLAAAGLTGPETAIEGARGLFSVFAGETEAAKSFSQLMGDFGQRWHMPDVAFKFVPCCHYLHPFVEAAGLIAAQGVNPDDIADITLRIAKGAAGIVCEPWDRKLAPADGHAIRWSLPVIVAARLVTGCVDHETFSRPPSVEVLALARRSRWEPLEPDCFPTAFEAEISCHMQDGKRVDVRVDDVFGNASRPASAADVLAKFRGNAHRRFRPEAAEMITNLFLPPLAPDLSILSKALRPCPERIFS